MKRFGTYIILLVLPVFIMAQKQRAVTHKKHVNVADSKIYTKVEFPAEFPGGLDQWRRFLERNLQIPEDYLDDGSETLRFSFVVEKDGSLTGFQSLNQSKSWIAETLRLFKLMPKWIPAKMNGKNVRYRVVPIVMIHMQ